MTGEQSTAVGYPLSLRVEYMRRPLMSTLLFSLAQVALLSEKKGETWEQVVAYLTSEGDWKAVALIEGAEHEAA